MPNFATYIQRQFSKVNSQHNFSHSFGILTPSTRDHQRAKQSLAHWPLTDGLSHYFGTANRDWALRHVRRSVNLFIHWHLIICKSWHWTDTEKSHLKIYCTQWTLHITTLYIITLYRSRPEQNPARDMHEKRFKWTSVASKVGTDDWEQRWQGATYFLSEVCW